MRVHAIAGIAAAILLTGCVLSEGEAFRLKADAYLETVPENRSASVRLMTKKLRENNLEYKQFYRKLKSVLEARGYDLTSDRPAVEIKLTFGVQNTGSFSAKYGFDTPDDASVRRNSGIAVVDIHAQKAVFQVCEADGGRCRASEA